MHDIDEEDEEETLSFCEFSISGDADTWEDSSRESQNTSFKSSEGDDYFEFFSGELSSGKASFSYTPPENIIFCGKLISFKQPISENAERIEKVKHKKHKRRGFFRWKWNLASSLKRRISRKEEFQEERMLQIPRVQKRVRLEAINRCQHLKHQIKGTRT